MVVIYSLDDTNVCDSRAGKFEGLGPVQVVESCTIVYIGGTSYSLAEMEYLIFVLVLRINVLFHVSFLLPTKEQINSPFMQ